QIQLWQIHISQDYTILVPLQFSKVYGNKLGTTLKTIKLTQELLVKQVEKTLSSLISRPMQNKWQLPFPEELLSSKDKNVVLHLELTSLTIFGKMLKNTC